LNARTRAPPHNGKPARSVPASGRVSNFGPFPEYVELDTYDEVMSVVEKPLRFTDEMMQLPEGPGLGMRVIEDKLQNFRRN
jgi:L-alanine-DL-glutamate epimerase-like enolase superfamily enzyme